MMILRNQLNELRGRLDEDSNHEDVEFVKHLEEIVKSLEALNISIASIQEKVNVKIKNLRLKELKPNLKNRKSGVIHRLARVVIVDGGYYYSPTCMDGTPLYNIDFWGYVDTNEPVTCKNCLKVLEREELN